MNKLKKRKTWSYVRNTAKRVGYFNLGLLLLAGLLIQVALPHQANADLLEDRALILSSSAKGDVDTDANGTAAAPGSGGNGAKAEHTVEFTWPLSRPNPTVNGIIIMYCTSPIFQDACTTPEGMTAEFLDAVTVTGLSGTAFALDTSTTNAALNAIAAVDNNGACNAAGGAEPGDRENCVVMKRGSNGGADTTAQPTAVITYGGGASDYIQNPIPTVFGNENYTFYARVLVFSDITYNTLVDNGGLAASTAQQVDITAIVKETLRFSVGTTATDKVSDVACTPFNDPGDLVLGDGDGVLDPAQAYSAYSYFRVNTNTVNGTTIYYSGETLVSGTNDIDEIGAIAEDSDIGQEQFGLGIDSTYDPPVPAGSGDAHQFNQLTGSAPYNNADGTITLDGEAEFAFVDTSIATPVAIASSTGGIVCDTGAVRYLGNISTSTPAGIYRTTITYIATGRY